VYGDAASSSRFSGPQRYNPPTKNPDAGRGEK
jgi:hypothetical protein